ncbi:carbohydrate ABC transporter permease [Acholeplasma laidlawii]|jgi:multiple sugar transport system permease protein|uniref:ABC-type transport system, permease component n=2 Tax=Acholeplasma laidlawii TaxID=2148 RepID=A9NEX1_ACHLI|nr:carbohydrate ABC transporter permease [Acholeplasma laidlawii]ABX80901.1 ABC-type transport system, permease component [Acholeplasma laidlawii PG-8A]NWH11923.1 carbohydrate ABC transporter permease [Acholeplasma laidlawii]NWH12668.1 carbohydrate ABC transporter permease [Acholeplasma laidlawii]NWH13952.1 carbohydrate ABC transporter permease [Acholeplasma laidlawii]OAN19886.1 ABC transporter permease [Acholeplasma laidlawii]
MNSRITANLGLGQLSLVEAAKERGKNIRRVRKFQSILISVLRALLLGGLCFIILYPVIQQVLLGLRAPIDANDPSVVWVPKNWSFQNFRLAMLVLDYWNALLNTFKLSAISMVLQVASTALAGYAFSRLKFKGSEILFIFVILTIVIPPQALSLAQYLYFRDLGLIGSENAIYLMSGLGQGIRSGIFIYIFRSFFKGLPKELEEAAQVDGASVFRIFWNVMLPNARGAIITVGLFAFVWQWNDTYYASIFNISTEAFPILTMRLVNAAENVYAALFYSGALSLIGQDVWSNPMFLATISNVAALLMMLPLLVMYLFVQKQFVESIERTGIVG